MESERKKHPDAVLLEDIFMKYRNGMYAVAFSILHDRYQAEDAVGDAYEKFIPYLGKCRQMEENKIKALLTRFVTGAGERVCGGTGMADRRVQAHRVLYEKSAV